MKSRGELLVRIARNKIKLDRAKRAIERDEFYLRELEKKKNNSSYNEPPIRVENGIEVEEVEHEGRKVLRPVKQIKGVDALEEIRKMEFEKPTSKTKLKKKNSFKKSLGVVLFGDDEGGSDE